MNFLSNIKVRTKLILAFLMVAILITLVGIKGITALKRIDANSESMYSNNLQNIYMMNDTKLNLTQIKSDIIQLVYVRDVSKTDELLKDIQSNEAENAKYIASCEKLPMNDVEKKIWPDFKTKLVGLRL